MTKEITEKLAELEETQNLRVLYACESGSRAWGFASPDSDFDVRFIYARRVEHYLDIVDQDDTAGFPVNEILDIAGWDIRKALKLFLKSNAPLYEWLQSPIVYREESSFARELRERMSSYFSLRAGAHHYISMATNTLRADLQHEAVKLKRYFYALRPALACKWIIERRAVPPMVFGELRTLIRDHDIQNSIDDLLRLKEQSDEKALIKPVKLLNQWLNDTLEECETLIPDLPATRKGTTELSALFRNHIGA